MTKTLPKLVLSASRDIPFSQLVLSQKNVRRVKAGLSIEDLAEDIYRRTLLQSINVRPLLDADGKETGKRDYYCQSARGNRLFELGLGEVALAFTATSSKADQLAIDAITGVHGCADFAPRWLRHRGLAWAAELLPGPSPLPQPGPRLDQPQE